MNTHAAPPPSSGALAHDWDYAHDHLLGIEGLHALDIHLLLDEADVYAAHNRQTQKRKAILKGLTQINMFFENSTRTLMSFDLAGKRLGADTISLPVSSSSIKKGETLLDTALTLNAMRPDVLVIRHGSSGAVKLIADNMDCAVINAGDGRHEHPTQALLDALTIRHRKGKIEGLIVAICGDILHSRVARSNIYLLLTLGAVVRLVGPPTLVPQQFADLGATIHHDMAEGLKDADIVMMLRLQQERMDGAFLPSTREYFRYFGLTADKLAYAKPDAVIMHPGPMNRGVEIDTHIADDLKRSGIAEQVEMGVAVRMACLDVLTRKARNVADSD